MDLPIEEDKFIKLVEEMGKQWKEIQEHPLVKPILDNMSEALKSDEEEIS